jgi:hypothetical protein
MIRNVPVCPPGPISSPPVVLNQPITQNFVGVDDALEGFICVVQPEICVAVIGVIATVAIIHQIHQFGKLQSNEWVDLARRVAAGFECAWLAFQKTLPQNQGSATQQKIVQAQKFLGCRNVQKRNQ